MIYTEYGANTINLRGKPNPNRSTPPQPGVVDLNKENDEESVYREYAVYVGHKLPEWVGYYRAATDSTIQKNTDGVGKK